MTNNTTLIDVEDLRQPLEANSVYSISGVLTVSDNGTASTNSTTDLIVDIDGPSGAKIHGAVIGPEASATAANARTRWEQFGGYKADGTTNLNHAILLGLPGGNVEIPLLVDVEIETGSTAGDLRVRWAQNVLGTTVATFHRGSRLLVVKL